MDCKVCVIDCKSKDETCCGGTCKCDVCILTDEGKESVRQCAGGIQCECKVCVLSGCQETKEGQCAIPTCKSDVCIITDGAKGLEQVLQSEGCCGDKVCVVCTSDDVKTKCEGGEEPAKGSKKCKREVCVIVAGANTEETLKMVNECGCRVCIVLPKSLSDD